MSQIQIYEVGPRDGFQNIEEYIPVETKLAIIEMLISSGIRHVQLTSFVSPKAIPQMRDARELTDTCLRRHPQLDWFALVPNLFGARTAWESGIRKVSYVVSLSKSHNKANINRTHEESLQELLRIRHDYPDLAICLDLATAFGCPFEGKYCDNQAVEFIKPYVEAEIRTLNLCDTIGIADPKQVRALIRAVKQEYPSLELMIHIHDTRNMGMVNTLSAIEMGIQKVQSTLGGLGGCPFAYGASGNLSTEDLVHMLNEMGFETGVDGEKLIQAAVWARTILPDGIYSGHQINIRR